MFDAVKALHLQIMANRDLFANYQALSTLIGYTSLPTPKRMELYRQREVVEVQLIEAGAL
jgi:hypothetical protein